MRRVTNPGYAWREVGGALERPADTEIAIVEDGDDVAIKIPRPRMPWPLIAALCLYLTTLLLAFVVGVIIFIFHHSFPLYHTLFGSDLREAPWAAKLFFTLGWLIMLILGFVSIAAAIRPILRRESIIFAKEALIHQDNVLFSTTERRHPYSTIIDFRDKQDRQHLVESQVLMRLVPVDDEWPVDVEFALSTNEAEKQWLVSALNVLLARYRS